jgi:arylsulfatase A-like enzyme
MRRTFYVVGVAASLVAGGMRFTALGQGPRPGPASRNVIIFVADGLRHGSVNEQDMPTLSALRSQGVDFRNSYSLFPTFTMANASAIATGHGLGDTGVFSNTIWAGYSSFDTGNFNRSPGTPVPFIENDQVLGDLDDHFQGNFIGETSLLATARASGYNTAAIGKLGPVALQDVSTIAPEGKDFPFLPASILIDDSTALGGAAVPAAVRSRMDHEGLTPEAPTRTNGYGATSSFNNGYSGERTRSGTLMPNIVQQQWFADVATRVVLPMFAAEAKPFALLYWSRDPDGTQHNQGDSLNELFPGINGPTSRRALQNADHNLKQLLDWLDAHPDIKANTDVFVTSDHGFATISRREIERAGRLSRMTSAQHVYLDANGRVDTEKGTLPPGFLAIDLAVDFHFNLFDPDRRVLDAGRAPYRTLDITASDAWEHPVLGNGLIGGAVEQLDGSDARIIVAANGGADLVYVPNGDPDLVRAIGDRVLGYDYVSAVFVDDAFGGIPGALPLSAIHLVGAGRTPRPTIVVTFKTFYLNPDDLQTAAQISDSTFQEGQGMHGGFGRECTFNAMAAIGPDFKKGFADEAPVSNADIAPTIARVLGLTLPTGGALKGRVIGEALSGAPPAPVVRVQYLASAPAGGTRTAMYFEELDGERYSITACRVADGRQNPASPSACR